MMNNHSTSLGTIKAGMLSGFVSLAVLGLMTTTACDPNDNSEFRDEIEQDAPQDDEDMIEMDAAESLVDDDAVAAGGMGMTWRKSLHNSTIGTDRVGCGGCDPYVGDTVCTDELPVLCIKKDGSPDPGIVSPGFYNGWASGHIGLTPAVAGTALTSLAVANDECETFFGPGYRMAEHHDGGGGWNWNAFGNINDASRFWTYIKNQPGNCWNP